MGAFFVAFILAFWKPIVMIGGIVFVAVVSIKYSRQNVAISDDVFYSAAIDDFSDSDDE